MKNKIPIIYCCSLIIIVLIMYSINKILEFEMSKLLFGIILFIANYIVFFIIIYCYTILNSSIENNCVDYFDNFMISIIKSFILFIGAIFLIFLIQIGQINNGKTSLIYKFNSIYDNRQETNHNIKIIDNDMNFIEDCSKNNGTITNNDNKLKCIK